MVAVFRQSIRLMTLFLVFLVYEVVFQIFTLPVKWYLIRIGLECLIVVVVYILRATYVSTPLFLILIQMVIFCPVDINTH